MTTEPAAPALVERTPSSLKYRLYVMMFLQYFIQGSYLPVISLYLQEALSFNSDQLGDFGSALAIGPLLAPFIVGQIVDRHFSTQHVLAFCHLAGGVIMLVLYGQTDFWPIMILGALYSALYIPSMMLTNSLAFHHLKDSDREFPLIRLWGTIGFVVPAWVVEFWYLDGLEEEQLVSARGVILIFAGVAGLLMGLYSLTLPHTPPSGGKDEGVAPGKVLAMLRHRYFLTLVVISFLVAISHKFFFVWNSPFLKVILQKGGVLGAWEQRIASLGQVFEVVVMAGLGISIKRYGFKAVMLTGTIAYCLRCLVFATASAMSGAFPLVMSLVCLGQALHGFCFGCFLAAAYMFMDRISPKDARGSMQTFYGTFVVGVGMLAGGRVSGQIGGLFARPVDEPLLRQTLGIASTAGVTIEAGKAGAVGMQWDWTGLWLAGAFVAGIAVVGFAIAFPRTVADTEESSR